MHAEPFAVTSLDAGMSSAVAFFFADEAVLCHLGVAATTTAVLRGDRREGEVAAWCQAVRAEAKRVVVIPDGEIRSVRIRLRMMPNELSIARDGGGVEPTGYRSTPRAEPAVLRFNLLERAETDQAVRLLAERYRGRFELATTRVFAFMHGVAPLLTR
jgi:hypothetical protein